MVMKLCTVCGEPSPGSRCDEHKHPQPAKLSREARGYDNAWRTLSKRARQLQPWCSHCGTPDDLTCDHLQWPARTLKDVDVLCRPCNARKGKPTAENDPRGKTLNQGESHPGAKAFEFTQSVTEYANGGADRG